MANELFTRKEVAQIFKIKPRTIGHWERRNLIKPAAYVNARPLYSIESIESLATEKPSVLTKKAKHGK
jgi:DNA-binding transcriptional MerR regulator